MILREFPSDPGDEIARMHRRYVEGQARRRKDREAFALLAASLLAEEHRSRNRDSWLIALAFVGAGLAVVVVLLWVQSAIAQATQ